MPKKQIVYMHKTRGEIKICRTELEGQMCGKSWTKILFTKNKEGENVMRVNFDQFTMDILPNGTREVIDDGNGNAE